MLRSTRIPLSNVVLELVDGLVPAPLVPQDPGEAVVDRGILGVQPDGFLQFGDGFVQAAQDTQVFAESLVDQTGVGAERERRTSLELLYKNRSEVGQLLAHCNPPIQQ